MLRQRMQSDAEAGRCLVQQAYAAICAVQRRRQNARCTAAEAFMRGAPTAPVSSRAMLFDYAMQCRRICLVACRFRA